MGIFSKSALNKNQRKQIMDATGCSKGSAENRARTVLDHGSSIDHCLDQGLFNLTVPLLNQYFKSTVMKAYAQEKSKALGVREYDIVEQMLVAKSSFNISPFDFAKYDLFGRSEEDLEEFKRDITRRKHGLILRLMKATGMSQDEVLAELERVKKKFNITPNRYYKFQLYGKSDEEIQQYIDTRKGNKEDTVREICEVTGWSPENVLKDMDQKSARFGIQRSDYPILRCYELSDELLGTYGNLRDSRLLNEKYNDKGATKYLRRKDLFDNYFGEFIGRKHWMNQKTTFEEYIAFSDGLDEVFCKPKDAANAKGTQVVELKGKDPKEMYDWFMAQPLMLVEERVRQHHEMDEFYDNSVNTVRLFTLLDNDEFVVFASFVRIGANGSIADNLIAGGVGCGVDVETGAICTPAIDHEGKIFETHPNSGKRFEGFKIPHWDLALEVAERALRKNPDLNYIGWDIAIREDDVVIIEGNSCPDIGTCQLFFNIGKRGIKESYERYLG